MEIPVKSIDEQLQMQDQTLIYQLRRSCHKIEQLKEEVEKLRKEKDSQLIVLSTLQIQLRQSKKEIQQLQSHNMDIVTQLNILSKKLAIVQSNDENRILQQQMQALTNRYLNCQQENNILRSELRCRDLEAKSYKDQVFLSSNANKNQEAKIQELLDQLDQQRVKNLQLQQSNHFLETLCKDHKQREKEVQLLLQQYKNLLAHLQMRLGEAQRSQEGWYCQYSDLKDTVQHIEEVRANFRLKKIVKNH